MASVKIKQRYEIFFLNKKTKNKVLCFEEMFYLCSPIIIKKI